MYIKRGPVVAAAAIIIKALLRRGPFKFNPGRAPVNLGAARVTGEQGPAGLGPH